MLVARTQCARCERDVLLAPTAPTGEPGLFEVEDYPIEDVPPEMRYAFHRRKQIMEDLNTVPEHLLPKVCAIPHSCPIDLDALAENEMERKRLLAALDSNQRHSD